MVLKQLDISRHDSVPKTTPRVSGGGTCRTQDIVMLTALIYYSKRTTSKIN